MCFLAGYPTSSMFKFKKIFCFEKSDMCSIDVIQKKEAEKLFSHMFPSVWQLDHSALKLFGIWCKDTNKHIWNPCRELSNPRRPPPIPDVCHIFSKNFGSNFAHTEVCTVTKQNNPIRRTPQVLSGVRY